MENIPNGHSTALQRKNPPPPPPRKLGESLSSGELPIPPIKAASTAPSTAPAEPGGPTSPRTPPGTSPATPSPPTTPTRTPPPPVPLRKKPSDAALSVSPSGSPGAPINNCTPPASPHDGTGDAHLAQPAAARQPPPPIPQRGRNHTVASREEMLAQVQHGAQLREPIQNEEAKGGEPHGLLKHTEAKDKQPAQDNSPRSGEGTVIVGPRPPSVAGSTGAALVGQRAPAPGAPPTPPKNLSTGKKRGSMSERQDRQRSITGGETHLAVPTERTDAPKSPTGGGKLLAEDLHQLKLDDVPQENDLLSMKRLSGFLLKKRRHSISESDGKDGEELLHKWKAEEKRRRNAQKQQHSSETAEREKNAKAQEEESLRELRKLREEDKLRRKAADQQPALAGLSLSPRAIDSPLSAADAGTAVPEKVDYAKKTIENMYGITRRGSEVGGLRIPRVNVPPKDAEAKKALIRSQGADRVLPVVNPGQASLGQATKFSCKRWGIGHHKGRGHMPQIKKLKRDAKEEVVLSLDNRGIAVLTPQGKELVIYALQEIDNWGHSRKTFSFILVDKGAENAFEFKTQQGKELFDKLAQLKTKNPARRAGSPATKGPPPGPPKPGAPIKRARPDTQYFNNLNLPGIAASTSPQPVRPAPKPPGVSRAASGDDLQRQRMHLSEPPSNPDQKEVVIHRPASAPGGTSAVAHDNGAPRKKLSMREEIFNELIATERIYNRHLNVMVEGWMARLKGSGLIEQSDIQVIFSNIEQIKNLNKELMISLDELVDLPAEQQNVGERFLSFVAFLKLYTQYCSNESIGLKRLMETKRANPALEEFLEAFKQEEQSEKLNLESFLIKPLQRLTKYPLLLKTLMENTSPDHPDYKNLTVCYEECHKVVGIINEQKRQSENLQKLLEIQQNFLEDDSGEPLKLVEATRRFVMEGSFKKVMKGSSTIKKAILFLFNDILLLAVKKGRGNNVKYQAKSEKIKICDILVWDDDHEGNLTFSIVGTSTDKLTVFAASAEEKKHWIDEINNNLVNLPNVQLLKSLQNSDSVEKFSRQV